MVGRQHGKVLGLDLTITSVLLLGQNSLDPSRGKRKNGDQCNQMKIYVTCFFCFNTIEVFLLYVRLYDLGDIFFETWATTKLLRLRQLNS